VTTTYGEVGLEVPRDRAGNFEPQVVKKYQRTLGEVEDKIVSLYARGMSTRDIQSHLRELYGIDLSASTMSTITEKVMVMAQEWQNRCLEDVYVIVYFDAIHYKVRQDGKVITKAAYTCLGIDTEGMRDVLGIWVGEREGAAYWITVFSELRNRGVQDILIACVDGLKGFSEAIQAVFPKTEVQQCIIHQIRTSLRYVAWKDRQAVTDAVRSIYTAPAEEQALNALEQLDNTWGKKYPAMVRSWRINWEHLTAFLRYPIEIRRLMYTTNAVEALHRCFRKVTKTKALFPHDESLQKILFLAYRELYKRWDRSVNDWGAIATQLLILFDGRVIFK
jgi:transposase-like protein